MLTTPLDLCDLERRARGTHTLLDVRLDGAVYTLPLVAVDHLGIITVEHPDTDRRRLVERDDVEGIDSSTCVACGEPYDEAVNPEDCDLAYGPGHAEVTCPGCGDAITDPADHRRCHLIP